MFAQRPAGTEDGGPWAPVGVSPEGGVLLLERLLQLAAGGELRNASRGDRHLLAGAGVHALPLLAMLWRELAEARESDLLAALESFGDRIEECVDRLRCIPLREPALRCHPVGELGLCHCPLLPSTFIA